MSTVEQALLHNKFKELKKMNKKQILEECKMWRNIWGWIPSAIKYYVSRTGSQVGISVRNYHRFVGVLLDTKWELKGVEVGVWEKVYDQNDGQYYFERKIIQLPTGQIIAFDWIKERINMEEMEAKAEEASEEKGKTV